MNLCEQVASVRRTLYRLLNRRLSARTRRPFQQLIALKAIALRDVRTQAQLAERLMIDAPAVSRLVDRLVEEGLVKRGTGEDRRCVHLQVTNACWPEVEVLEEEGQRVDDELGRHLSPEEMLELKRLLDKVQAGLAQSSLLGEKPLSEKPLVE
jgi:MarR family transcriptional regulator, transcriptional regulator for hemolysin